MFSEKPFWDGSFSKEEGGSMNGRLEVITGCMFSGKTEELIRRIKRVRIAHGHVLVFKPTIDDRYKQNAIVTHYGRELDAHLFIPGHESFGTLKEVMGEKKLRGATVVAFDEGNFFSDKLPALCEVLVAEGKRVIVAGLDLTFAGKPFGPMPALMALADDVAKLHAVCVKCGEDATRTQRLIDGKPAPLNDEVVKVGGLKDYEARCLDCWEIG